MATYKYSGQMRDGRDTQLWKEMVQKERFLNTEHRDFKDTVDFSGGKSGLRSQSND